MASHFCFWCGLKIQNNEINSIQNIFSYVTVCFFFYFQSTVRNEQKELNISPVHDVNVNKSTATFGMGCFWGAESLYGATRGVLRTTVGYAGGSSELPTYRKM